MKMTTATTSPSSSLPVGEVASNFDTGRFVVADVVPRSSAGDPSGNFRTICSFSHLSNDDPIVYPGQPGKSHLHMFFGNTLTDANSTYQSLRTTGDGTCQGGPVNRSAYWAPALLNAAGQVVVPDTMIVYYKGISVATAAEIAAIPELPAGLKMIAGYNFANPSTPTHFDWFCTVNPVKQQTIPSCPAGEQLEVQLNFPQCWDGVNLDAADHRSHLAYVEYNNSRFPTCPAGFIHIPELTVAFQWTPTGDTSQWYLSSDRMAMPGMADMIAPNGSTFHSDWIGAWDPAVKQTWTTHCINQLLDCTNGQLGDGTRLSTTLAYSGPKLLNPPTP
jgi:hypothetical protein